MTQTGEVKCTASATPGLLIKFEPSRGCGLSLTVVFQ